MITITAKLTGNIKDLEMVLACGIKCNSTKKLSQDNLVITWICEESDYNEALQDCIDLINLREVKLWNCNLVSIS